MAVGNRIRSARIQKGMTQKELAQKLGISPQGIVQWENGARNPKPETLERIASALGVSYWTLAEVPDETENAPQYKPSYDSPYLQDPSLVADMVLNDLTILEIMKGQKFSSPERNDLLQERVYLRAKQYNVPSDLLLTETQCKNSRGIPLIPDRSGEILKEFLGIMSEMSLDGQISLLLHARELAKIPDYKKEH